MDIKISKNQQYCLNGMLGFTTGFLLNRSVAWISPDLAAYSSAIGLSGASMLMRISNVVKPKYLLKLAPFTYPFPSLRSKLFKNPVTKDSLVSGTANHQFQYSVRHIRENCLAICMIGIMGSLLLCTAINLRSRIPGVVGEWRGRTRLMRSLARDYGLNNRWVSIEVQSAEAWAEFRQIYPSDLAYGFDVTIVLLGSIGLFVAGVCSIWFTYKTWGKW